MIENAALKYIDIHPECIEKADGICERVCEEHGIDSDSQVWEYVKESFEENIYSGNLTNEIVYYIFRNLKEALVESGACDESRIDWFINGWDTHFYIDGEEQ